MFWPICLAICFWPNLMAKCFGQCFWPLYLANFCWPIFVGQSVWSFLFGQVFVGQFVWPIRLAKLFGKLFMVGCCDLCCGPANPSRTTKCGSLFCGDFVLDGTSLCAGFLVVLPRCVCPGLEFGLGGTSNAALKALRDWWTLASLRGFPLILPEG